MALKCLALLLLTVACAQTVWGQNDCPSGWTLYENKCYYFSNTGPTLSWSAAESWCQQNNGHLVSFATVEERDWVVRKNLKRWDITRWWIGLNDIASEMNFAWSDGTPYDPDVANWKPLEPNNAYLENCVEIWIKDPRVNDQQWNDRTCEGENAFVCKRDPGAFTPCPSNYQQYNGRCYYASNVAYQWLDAQQECRVQGANLVSISDVNEENFVENLISSQSTDFWIGLSDTSTSGTLTWLDTSTSSSYANWANGQPTTPLPYYGSTCVEKNRALGYKWNTGRCSNERRFVCERGPKAQCPPTWLYSSDSGKCYEIVNNPNRVETWSAAKLICQGLGGGLLKIQSQNEETFIGGVLEGYTWNGHPLLWLGASDVGHDNVLTWWDQTPVSEAFWASQMPQFVDGREDCVAVYTGKTNYNWETATCFQARPYICELPEGQALPDVPAISVDGKCETNWRHSNGKCYFFGAAEMTWQDAENYCTSKNAHLTSVLSDNEMSFIVGHLQRTSWIGLQSSSGSFSWVDGEQLAFENWTPGQPDGDGTCVSATQVGEWADAACSGMWPFVCKKNDIPTEHVTIPPPTYEPDYEKCGGDGWISDPSSDRCYKINTDLRNWQDARYACQVGGGDLVSINSPQENDHASALILNFPTFIYFFMGGSDQNTFNVDLVDDGWRWSDGSPFNYINWAPSEPNNYDVEDCMEMYAADGRWNDIDCFSYKPSICEKKGNMDNIVGPDITDSNCKSNEACCFKHLGAEYGGPLPDSALSASSERNQWFTAERGRLNTPEDVIIINDGTDFGNGHGAWAPNTDDPNKWLQVDLPYHSEVKGIITQGRNGIIQYTDRSWVTTFKVSYSQDADGGKWEFISDENGDPVVFKGNSDQNTQVTNLFPRPVIARHVRCHPVTWFDAPCMRLEYIGCKTSCLAKLGMNSGMIADDKITASSSKSGREPKQARAPVDPDECLADSTDKGENYRGWISKTVSGLTCQAWSSQEPHRHSFTSENYPNAGLYSNKCRNPNGRDAPWCLTTDPDKEWELCSVPVCPAYTPAGWAPTTASSTQYVQVQFEDYFKVSGVTLYSGGRSSYVKSYTLAFSDNGNGFKTYQDQSGTTHTFTGLASGVSEYQDILREPISTRYIRLYPQSWQGEPIMQFELNGCYVDSRITCSDPATLWQDQNQVAVECPAGCVEDLGRAPVYGTDTYTLNSGVCPAAVHAGKILNSHGGQVSVKQIEGLVAYEGSYRNGITSESFGPYSASFQFSEDSLRCDDGWLAWQDKCYFLSYKGVAKTWHDARADCISMGGDLVSILSEGENSFIEAQIYQADLGGDIWIGFNDLDVVNYYQWSDGSPVTLTNWFWNEPVQSNKQCVNIYRFEGYWNDKKCDDTYPYMCKKDKQLLPPVSGPSVIDEGCDAGWRAYESSCYWASDDEYMFIYANHICEEKGGKLASVHDDFEQSFIFSLVINSLPPGLGYTSWIGLSAKTETSGSLYYEWESGEPVSYTHWDKGEPEVRFSCAFPFVYKDVTYYECTTVDHPARLEDTPWCSIDPVYNGRWINCDTGYEYGCTFMDDRTGFWQIDICGQNRYYVCEKAREGYTQPVLTTPSTAGTCEPGWYGSEKTTACYQINDKNDRAERVTWMDALNFCRAQNADLVSVHSYEEEQEIAYFVAMAGVYSYTSFWMGLNNIDLTEGYEWSDGTPVSYTNWNYGEPNDHNGNEKCVENQLIGYSMWNDINCDAVRNWICKIPKGTKPLDPPTIPPPGGQVSTECGTDGEWIRFMPSYGADKCYLFVDEVEHGWAYAEKNCTARGGHLVAIHSADENSFILGRVARTSVNSAWIGLRAAFGSDGSRSFMWSDNSTLDYINWANGEPNDYFEQEDCAEMSADGGLWNDDNCGVQMGFICEKYLGSDPIVVNPTPPVPGGCAPGFTAYGNKCWMFGGFGADSPLDWFTAIERCGNFSSEIATVQNAYEQAFITSMLPAIGGNVWIGLNGRINNEFVWHDQSEVSYTNWDQFEPNGYSDSTCVEVLATASSAGKWMDNWCYDMKAFACYTMRSSMLPDPTTPVPDQCANGYMAWGDACYRIMDQVSTRSAAKEQCEAEENTYLLSITDVYENNLITSWFLRDILSGTSIWTGMTFTTESTDNGDTVTTFKWDDSWPVEYTNWGAMEPDSDVLESGAGCIRMNNDGTWNVLTSATCQTASYPFVCKKSLVPIPTTSEPLEQGNCDPGFYAFEGFCYYIETAQNSDNYRSWYEAVYECESRGATLASFHSEQECLAVVNAIDGGSHNLFIGLSSNGFSGWSWADDSGVDFFNWVPGEPNGQGNGEDCVEMYPWDGQWNDVDCFQGRGYICKKAQDLSACGRVDPSSRTDCGESGIEESLCLRRGCCWDPLDVNANFSGCFYPDGVVIGPSGQPITDTPATKPVVSGALSTGAIVGIVIGVIALLCGAIGIYCCMSGNKKVEMPSMPSMPTMPSMPWSSGGAGTTAKKPEAGFENPVVSMSSGVNMEYDA